MAALHSQSTTGARSTRRGQLARFANVTAVVLASVRRTNVIGAIDLSIWDRTGEVDRAAGVDLQIELLDGEPFLLATSGHPDDNGHRFLFQRVAR